VLLLAAKYDFVGDPNDPTQMTLRLGERLTQVRVKRYDCREPAHAPILPALSPLRCFLRKEIGNGWSEGTKATGDRGVFPSSYVEIEASAPPPPPPPAGALLRCVAGRGVCSRPPGGGGAAPKPVPPPPSTQQSAAKPIAKQAEAKKEEAKEELTVQVATYLPKAYFWLGTDAKVSQSTDALIPEIEQNVRDWRAKLMSALHSQNFSEYYKIKNQV
jgi:hypothetical protein